MPRLSAVLAVSLVLLGMVVGAAIAGSGRQTVTLTETRQVLTTLTVTRPVTATVLADTDVSVRAVCFSKTANCASVIIDLINRANRSVLVAIFSFTRDDIAAALIRAKNRGVEVRVVMERERANESGSEYRRLRDNRVDVRLDGNSDLMHHKFIVVDERLVITGSYNFSVAAEDRNDENVVVILSERVADRYRSEFERVWSLASP
ncbi:MAG: phospholipase D family protein [Candidatus Caldarchaeales archaeon]